MRICFLILLVFFGFACNTGKVLKQPNILFIAVDDLRPELNCFGADYIKSPNIDKLASEGIIFTRAYCNVPVCGASRASLMTGIKPSRDRFVTFATWAEKDLPDGLSLPEYFKQHGYSTVSNGKIFHHKDDMQESWTEEPWRPTATDGNWRNYVSEAGVAITKNTDNGRGLPFEAADVADEAYFDGKIAEKTIEDLHKLSKLDRPFFLAAGFLKPHLPFNAPQKYWDMYDRTKISLPDNYYRPAGAPDAAIHNFGELRAYYGIPPEGPVSDSMAISLIHGYYACVTYTDAQIGKIIEVLKELDIYEHTVIVLWGDHGWQLGEHTLWCKHSNFDLALRVPIIIKAPGYQGLSSKALVETVDLFPTICELAGLPLLGHLHGESLVPLMKSPQSAGKEVIYARFHDGESIKTDRYLYTEWRDDTGKEYARMLYDHQKDSEENVNIAEEDSNSELVKKLNQMLNIEIEKAQNVKPVQ